MFECRVGTPNAGLLDLVNSLAIALVTGVTFLQRASKNNLPKHYLKVNVHEVGIYTRDQYRRMDLTGGIETPRLPSVSRPSRGWRFLKYYYVNIMKLSQVAEDPQRLQRLRPVMLRQCRRLNRGFRRATDQETYRKDR